MSGRFPRLCRLATGIALVTLSLAVMAACGIPSDETATLADPSDVPFDLLTPAAAPNTTVTSPAGSESDRATVFLVLGERLATVERRVPAPASPDVVLEALERGPTETEAQFGMRSALTGDNVVRSVGAVGGIATVDLGPSFTDIIGTRDQILALAQIVSTLTRLPGIGRVNFTLEGVPVGVPRGDGAVTTESVSIDDYALLAPVPTG